MILLLLVLLIFLLAIAALILVPFQLCSDLRIDGFSVTGFYKIKWFGLTLRRAELAGPRREKRNKLEEEEKKQKDEMESRTKNAEKKHTADKRSKVDRLRFLKDPLIFIDILPSIFRILKDLMKTIHIECLLLEITVGLDDPANTAVLCGYLWSMASLVPAPATIRIDPYFGGDRLNGSMNAEIWCRLLWVFVAFINALREKPIRRLLKEMSRKSLRDLRNKPLMRRPLWGPKGQGNGNRV